MEGLPLGAESRVRRVSRGAGGLGAAIGKRTGTPVALMDGRLSSHEAEARLLADGRRHEAVRRERDAMAAAIIVETWLAEQH